LDTSFPSLTLFKPSLCFKAAKPLEKFYSKWTASKTIHPQHMLRCTALFLAGAQHVPIEIRKQGPEWDALFQEVRGMQHT
jgi:hypothetical protein